VGCKGFNARPVLVTVLHETGAMLREVSAVARGSAFDPSGGGSHEVRTWLRR
jgi:hypothetical protein